MSNSGPCRGLRHFDPKTNGIALEIGKAGALKYPIKEKERVNFSIFLCIRNQSQCIIKFPWKLSEIPEEYCKNALVTNNEPPSLVHALFTSTSFPAFFNVLFFSTPVW